MSAQTIIGTCRPEFVYACSLFVLENVCAEILNHNALCFPSVIITVNFLLEHFGRLLNSWGIKFVNICENQVLWNISEFIIYCIHKCSKELFKAFFFIDFQLLKVFTLDYFKNHSCEKLVDCDQTLNMPACHLRKDH